MTTAWKGLRLSGTAFIFLLLCTGTVARAQTNPLIPDTGASGTGEEKFNVSVVNQTQQAINFVLRPKEGTWTEYVLQTGEKSVYSCIGCGGDFEIKLRTGEIIVSYSIRTGNLYGIRLNDEKNIFDVYVLQ
jgi:hypothetical protein